MLLALFAKSWGVRVSCSPSYLGGWQRGSVDGGEREWMVLRACDAERCHGRRRSNTDTALRDDLGVPLDSSI